MNYVPDFYSQKGNQWDDWRKGEEAEEYQKAETIDTSTFVQLTIDEAFDFCIDSKCGNFVETYRGDYPELFCKKDGGKCSDCNAYSRGTLRLRSIKSYEEAYEFIESILCSIGTTPTPETTLKAAYLILSNEDANVGTIFGDTALTQAANMYKSHFTQHLRDRVNSEIRSAMQKGDNS